jgi:hypothetical protein
MSHALAEAPKQRPLFIERPGEIWEFVGSTFEEHVECWQIVDGEVQKDKWKLSAVAASLDTKYDAQTVKRFAHETRRSARRIWEYAQTYRAFEKCERSQILSFHHHTVASTADDPVEAIHKAEDGEWSTRELEKWIKTGIEPGQDEHGPKEDETKVLQTPEAQEWLAAVHVSLLTHMPAVPANASFLKHMIQAMDGVVLQQSERTVEGDCRTIMLAIEETGGLSGDDLFDWLIEHFYFMSEDQLSSRLLTMVAEKTLIEEDAGKAGKQAKRRGKLPQWYEPYYVKRKKPEGAICKRCGEWHRDPADCMEI